MTMLGRFLRTNAVALLALAIALSGTAYAVSSLPKHSVGAKQLKKNAVTGSKVKRGSLTGTDLKDGSVTGADLGPASVAADQLGVPLAAQVRLTNTAPTVTVTNNVPLSPIAFEAEDFDTGNLWSPAAPDRLTIPRTGLWSLAGVVSFSASATGRRRAVLYRPYNANDPSHSLAQAFAHGDGVDGQSIALSTLVPLNAGDTVSLAVFQDSGAPLDLEGLGFTTVLSAHYVGATS